MANEEYEPIEVPPTISPDLQMLLAALATEETVIVNRVLRDLRLGSRTSLVAHGVFERTNTPPFVSVTEYGQKIMTACLYAEMDQDLLEMQG